MRVLNRRKGRRSCNTNDPDRLKVREELEFKDTVADAPVPGPQRSLQHVEIHHHVEHEAKHNAHEEDNHVAQ